jgi:flagellar biosynthesis GTPase FlhF
MVTKGVKKMDKLLSVGKVIKMACMRSGLCKYSDETVLVTKEFLEKLAPTMQGVPVVLDHPDMRITDQNIGTLPVVGRVADMHFDSENDVWLAHFVIDSAKAVELLQHGYGVSTAWIGTEYAGGGTFNNCPYDREAVEGRYEHLAIVQNPRYEMAVGPIFLNAKDGQIDNNKVIINNDVKKGANSMFGKVWKKITQREELMANSNEELVIEIDGVEKPLKDFIEDFKANAKKNETEEKYEIDGDQMTVNELISAFKNLKMKKNEAEEEEKKKKDEEEEAKKNEEEEKKKKDEEEAKKNEEEAKKNEEEEKEDKVKKNSRFNELDELHENAGNKVNEAVFFSLKERTELGKNRYGSKK